MKIETLVKNLELEIIKFPFIKDDITKLKNLFLNNHFPKNYSVSTIVEILKNNGILCIHNTNIALQKIITSFDIIETQNNINELHKHYNNAKLIQDNYHLLSLTDLDIDLFDKYVKLLSRTYISALVDMETKHLPMLIDRINNLTNDTANLQLIINANLLINKYKLTNDEFSNKITELHQAIYIFCKKNNITQEKLDTYKQTNTKQTNSKSTVWNKALNFQL